MTACDLQKVHDICVKLTPVTNHSDKRRLREKLSNSHEIADKLTEEELLTQAIEIRWRMTTR